MNEGVFRVLEAAARGATRRTEIARISGEALSVVGEVLTRHPKWFEVEGKDIRVTKNAFTALGHELLGRLPSITSSPLAVSLSAIARKRPAPRRELDQVFATTETVARRVDRLISAGELQRGIAFLGDDDLTSLGLHLSGGQKRTTVFEIDERLVKLHREVADERGFDHRVIHHDLREPIDKKLRERFGCVFLDPPYAIEGFTLFLSRAIDLLKPDGRLYICFGTSRRASERGLAKQRVISDAGLFIEEVLPGFNEYDGALALGARSSLIIARMTPRAKPLMRGHVEGELYTSRSPNKGGAEEEE